MNDFSPAGAQGVSVVPPAPRPRVGSPLVEPRPLAPDAVTLVPRGGDFDCCIDGSCKL